MASKGASSSLHLPDDLAGVRALAQEQIDALTTLSTNPFKFLVVPRLVAGLLMLPVLVLIAVAIIVALLARLTRGFAEVSA